MTACGGGGGDPNGPLGGSITATGDGYVTDDGFTRDGDSVLRVGDDPSADLRVAWVRPPLGSLNPNGDIVAAQLLHNWQAGQGAPTAALGRMRFVRGEGGAGPPSPRRQFSTTRHEPARR